VPAIKWWIGDPADLGSAVFPGIEFADLTMREDALF